jgi:hypothetical protein
LNDTGPVPVETDGVQMDDKCVQRLAAVIRLLPMPPWQISKAGKVPMADVSQIVTQVLVEVDPSAGIVKLSARDGVGPPPL